jgi:hypothetical protein
VPAQGKLQSAADFGELGAEPRDRFVRQELHDRVPDQLPAYFGLDHQRVGLTFADVKFRDVFLNVTLVVVTVLGIVQIAAGGSL